MTEAVLYDAAGPRGRRRILIGSVVGGLVVVGILAAAAARLAANGAFEAERWQVLTQSDLQRYVNESNAWSSSAGAFVDGSAEEARVRRARLAW